jgi:hypothetical protein
VTDEQNQIHPDPPAEAAKRRQIVAGLSRLIRKGYM